MSHTEYHIGKATKVDNPENKSADELAKEILANNGKNVNKLESFYDNYLEWLRDDLHEQYCYHSKTDTLYKLEDKEMDVYDDIIEAEYNDDGTINYQVRFYNGGAGLEECIEEAFDKLGDAPEIKASNKTFSWDEVEEFARKAFYAGREFGELKDPNNGIPYFKRPTFNGYLREINAES